MTTKKKKTPIINRELSWLSFNERVLQEASDPDVPLIERLKFLGIVSSNLDEFFRVRVANLQRMADAGIGSKQSLGGSPRKLLKEIQQKVVDQRDRFDHVFAEVSRQLKQANIFIVNETELVGPQASFVDSYFETRVRPALVPIMLDAVPKFPYLKNGVIYLAVKMWRHGDSGEEKGVRYALIELPTAVVPRFIVLPRVDDRNCLIMLDDLIRRALTDIFAIFEFDVIGAWTIKLTRDAELDMDDDVTASMYEKIARSLEQRKHGNPVRFVYDREIPKDLVDYIIGKMKIGDLEHLISGGRYHNARDFVSFPNVGGPSLENDKVAPLAHHHINGSSSVLAVMKERDVLLHFPYHSFHYVIDLLREAAIDPRVRSIKMTLYRVARNSRVINALINAMRNGKKVTVVLELQARFDEEANIAWTRQLEDEGAHIITGVPGLKVHSKMCLIRRKEGKQFVDYAIVGTGNFNEDTARIYTDHALLTADRRITIEVAKVFDFLENTYRAYKYKHLLVSPNHTRNALDRFIRAETRNAKAGKEAYIRAKLNSLVDRDVIARLYQASQAGVKVDLVVRGACALIPGVEGLSENIRVVSILDKYLEHSRIMVFCNGGRERVYLSSADWMPRNLDNRVEVSVPIHDEGIKQELKHYLDIQFADTTKARVINETQDNRERNRDGREGVRAQVDIYRWLGSLAPSTGEDVATSG